MMLGDWRRKVNSEYEESVGYFVQMTKTVSGKNEKRRKEKAELMDDYIAMLEQKMVKQTSVLGMVGLNILRKILICLNGI